MDATKYGQLVPYYHFVQLGQGKNPLVWSMDCSEWAYMTQKPASSSDVGVEAPMPSEDSLPKYSTAPKVPHFDLQVDDKSNDGLSPCLENPLIILPPSPAPSADMLPLTNDPDVEVEVETSVLAVFAALAPANADVANMDVCQGMAKQERCYSAFGK